MKIISLLLLCLSITWARSPLRYRQRPIPVQTTLSSFQTNMSVLVGSGGTSTSNTTQIWTGTQSTKLIVGSTLVQFITSFPATNICADSFFRVTFFVQSKTAATNINAFQLAIGNSVTAYKSYGGMTAAASDSLQMWWPGWNHIYIPRRRMATTGSYNCASVDTLIIVLQAKTATTDTITMGQVTSYAPIYPRAVLIPNWDDGYTSALQYGIGKMDSLRTLGNNPLQYRSTLMLQMPLLGTAGHMTAAGVDSAVRRGAVDIGNQNTADDTLPFRTLDSAVNTMTHNWEMIRGRGWPGANLYSYSFGAKSHAIDSAFRLTGKVDCQRLSVNNSEVEPQQFGDVNSIRFFQALTGTLTVAEAVASVDSLITYKGVGVMIGHILSTDGSTGSSIWKQAFYSAFMDSVKVRVDAGLLDVKSLGDWFETYGRGFSPSRRSGFGGR